MKGTRADESGRRRRRWLRWLVLGSLAAALAVPWCGALRRAVEAALEARGSTHEEEVRLPFVQRIASADPIRCPFSRGGLRFCSLVDALSSVPLVGVEGHFWELDFREAPDEVSVLGWVGSAAFGDSTVVGVLDSEVESPGSELVFVWSTDGGQAWRRRTDLKKPHYFARFSSLELRSARDWQVEVQLDDCADCGAVLGAYAYQSHDAGRTWSAPTITPAKVQPAPQR